MKDYEKDYEIEESEFSVLNSPFINAIIKRKRVIKRSIAGVILIALAAGTLWFIGVMYAWFPPKDLGVRYTQADIMSAMAKTGIKVSYNGMTETELEQFRKDLGGKRLNINDYNWKFSGYERKSFTLSPSEATALLNNFNNIAPGLWWFDNIQVTVLPDGRMAGSCNVYATKLKNELYSDISNLITFPIPEKSNLYGDGFNNITNDTLQSAPQNVELGPLTLPGQYKTPDNVAIIDPYVERIYKVVPGLQIYSLTTDAQRNFVFDGMVPQKVDITKK